MLIVQTKSIIYDLIELTSAESNTTYDEITGGNILKKIVFLFFSCIFILMLTGCNYVSSEKEGKRIATEFIEALNNKDKNAVKELLSGYTLEIENIDEQIDTMFDFVDDKSLPVEKSEILYRGVSGQSRIRNGVTTEYIFTSPQITSRTGKLYSIGLTAYIQAADEKLIGITEIRVTDRTNFPKDDITASNIEFNNPENYRMVGYYIDIDDVS